MYRYYNLLPAALQILTIVLRAKEGNDTLFVVCHLYIKSGPDFV